MGKLKVYYHEFTLIINENCMHLRYKLYYVNHGGRIPFKSFHPYPHPKPYPQPHRNLHLWIIERFFLGKCKNYNLVNIRILLVNIYSKSEIGLRMPSRDLYTSCLSNPNCRSFRYMAHRHNSVICFKISSVSVTWRLCRWLCNVNLRTNQMYTFSNNSLFGY